MPTIEFDTKFQDLCKKMVEISFEFVDFNKKDIDTIYIFSSIEKNIFSFNVFYRILGKVTEVHELNLVSKKKYDVSDKKFYSFVNQGFEYLKKIQEIFNQDKREVPTLMKIAHFPKTGKFENNISYDIQYTNHKTRTADDIFQKWIEEIRHLEK